MTDREQIRRDAQATQAELLNDSHWTDRFVKRIGKATLALLAELEQAEHLIDVRQAELLRVKGDLLKEQEALEQAKRERDELVLQNEACGNAIVAAEARLAAVPALVEALRRIQHYGFDVNRACIEDLTAIKDLADEALASYEQPWRFTAHEEMSREAREQAQEQR